MLARLDEIPGVAESRVDWTGRRFLLVLEGDASDEEVGAKASAALGEGARQLDGDEVHEVLGSYRNGETWMRAGETLRLSRFEAGVLARRHGGEAASELGLGEEQERELVALFETELYRAFERMHSGRGIEDLPTEVESAARRILHECAGFLSPEQQAGLAEYLRRLQGS